MNPAWASLMILAITLCSLFAITLEIILYWTVQQEIGLKSFVVVGLLTLGTRVIAVQFIALYSLPEMKNS